MNQQQRAGKHPSFSRDRKPFGLTRETFCRKLGKPNKKKPVRLLGSLPCSQKEQTVQKNFKGTRLYSAIKKARRLAKSEHKSNVYTWPFRYIRFSPRSLESLRLCTDVQFTDVVKTVYKAGDESLQLCFQEALSEWQCNVITKLLNMWTPPRKDTEKVLETAILFEEWDLMQACIEHKVSARLLRAAILLVIDRRNWLTLQVFIMKLGNFALEVTMRMIRLDEIVVAGCTMLHHAIKQGNTTLMKHLLNAGASPDIPDTDGVTPHHTAASRHDWDTLQLLLQYSQNARAIASMSMRYGTTLLHSLCELGQTEIMETFLQMGADPLVTDAEGNSLMVSALEAIGDRENIMRVLIQSGMSTHQTLLSKPQSGTSYTRQMPSPMLQAVKNGQLRIVKMLYASGATSNEEIFHLTSLSCIENDRNIRTFLDEISSQPRSLRDLCALAVSHHMGCGPHRSQRAARSGLPPALCSHVLHEHVLSHNFLSDLPPDPISIFGTRSFRFARLNRFFRSAIWT